MELDGENELDPVAAADAIFEAVHPVLIELQFRPKAAIMFMKILASTKPNDGNGVLDLMLTFKHLGVLSAEVVKGINKTLAKSGSKKSIDPNSMEWRVDGKPVSLPN